MPQDESGAPKKATIRDNEDGTFTVSYVPDDIGRYVISVKYGEDEVPYSPYRMRSQPSGDAKKCVVSGDGIDEPVVLGTDACMCVDTSAAGRGSLHCVITAPDGVQLENELQHNADGTVQIFFTPKRCGSHRAQLWFGGEELPGSPFIIEVGTL